MLTSDELQMPAGQPRRIYVSLFCFSFDGAPDIADSPKLYFSATEDEATRRCGFRHYHESDSLGKQTMFRLDMQHPRFRNMKFSNLFQDYATVDTPIEVFYYEILGNGSCTITMCPGSSAISFCSHLLLSLFGCTFCSHFLRGDACVCQMQTPLLVLVHSVK